MRNKLLAIGAIGALVLGLGYLAEFNVGLKSPEKKVNPQAPASATVAVQKLDKSPQMQESRQRLIEKLIAAGIFFKVENPTGLPRIYTGPAWNAIDVDQKTKFASVVFAYHYDDDRLGNVVGILDGKTGKELGSYGPPRGLELD